MPHSVLWKLTAWTALGLLLILLWPAWEALPR
jgi:hypothetical protein